MYYIRTGDIDFEGLHLDKIKRITNTSDLKIVVRKDDVLFTRKGNYGKSAVVSDEILNSAISSEIMLLRVKDKKLSPYFLHAFLGTTYGQTQIERNIHGVSNFSITQDDVSRIKIKLVPKIFSEIEDLIKLGNKQKFSIAQLYKEAEQELLERIEWDSMKMDNTLSYTKMSKDVIDNERLDPEFYQLKFENLEKHLKKIGAITLDKFCQIPIRGVQPHYEENGDVLVINSKHLGRTEIDIDNAERTTEAFYANQINERARIEKLDVLMYSTGAYIGRTNSYLHDKKAIASNHVTIIRPDIKICDPVYLALYLNSSAGLMQTDQRASGSAQREIYSQEIAKYLIFIPHKKGGEPDLAWQKKLADKIIVANEARRSAKQKLLEAKSLIEQEILRLTD
jgi:restriction endonuclease S subunit